MRTLREEGPTANKKTLELLMQATDESGIGLTEDEIQDNIFTLLVAGFDTTATAAMAVLYELQQHSEVLAACDFDIGDFTVDEILFFSTF